MQKTPLQKTPLQKITLQRITDVQPTIYPYTRKLTNVQPTVSTYVRRYIEIRSTVSTYVRRYTEIQSTVSIYARKLDKSRAGITFAIGGFAVSILLSGILGLFSGTSVAAAQAMKASTALGSHAVHTSEVVLSTNVATASAPTANGSTSSASSAASAAPAPPPVASGSYQDIARQAATYYGISPDLFVRQITQESGFNPWAYSPAGAEGIAQFMPGTASTMGVNPWDPTSALFGGAHLMAQLNSQFGGNYAQALAAYNAGPGAVQYAISAGGANWYNYLPAESQHYVTVIMGR